MESKFGIGLKGLEYLWFFEFIHSFSDDHLLKNGMKSM